MSRDKKESDSLLVIGLSMLAYSLFAYVGLGIFFGLFELNIKMIQIGCISVICMIFFRETMASRPWWE